MGIYDLLADLAGALGGRSVDADAPKEEDDKEEKGGEEEEKDEGEEKEEEPEEEEEEEPEDVKPQLEEECAESKQCAPHKHHYEECAERVTKQMEENDGKAKEDCVEEFFHLAHCATACAAPKLFRQLK